MRGIISVHDKSGVAPFAARLARAGVELFSTGNTLRALSEAGVPVRPIGDLTNFPEILDGRVKTLHPAIHGGLLARRDDPEHMATLAAHGLAPIDLVVSNLYPFAATVADAGVALADALEQIDIGGPTLIRASAKNFPAVLTLIDPADYEEVAAAVEAGSDLPLARRRALAAKAFQHVAAYDTLVAAYLRGDDAAFPAELSVAADRLQGLRYGENPHQAAAFYRQRGVGPTPAGVATATQLHGKELSYNNILDADAAWQTALDFPANAVVVVKHAIPCGLAARETVVDSYRGAFAGDPVSAFGGIVAINGVLDADTAAAMSEVFYEVVLAWDYAPEALEVLGKKKALRLLRVEGQPGTTSGPIWRQVRGGFLVQTPDQTPLEEVVFTTVSERQPTATELADLRFAWRAVKHVRSNAIVLARDRALTGVGPGQPNRLDSAHLAVRRAGAAAAGSAGASDAFFPFPDALEVLVKAGVTAVAHPGGSRGDKDSIALANQHNVALVTTGMRHFRH
jgi:phosphoribosylaminoimidazolecarboxamide formyltransferase / IMP cyclohydrolase